MSVFMLPYPSSLIIPVADVSGSHHNAGMLMFVFKRTGYLREKPAMTQLS